jgi:uncharacterized protein YbaR (Trm112 family)
MPIDPEFLSILRCPKTRKPLREATAAEVQEVNRRIAARELSDASGRVVEQPVEEGLVPDDEPILYPVQQGIPVLLIQEAIQLGSFRPAAP